MSTIKPKLYNLCLRYLQDRVAAAENAIAAAREASFADTKSSAGDKYETGREMLQQQIVQNEGILQEARKLLYQLGRLNSETIHETVAEGSVVHTNNGNFYIAVGAGQYVIDETNFITISPASPLARQLTGRKAGEKASFNGRSFEIKEVY